MAQSPSPQRVYTAPCPGCGAPLAFRSAQSTHAVCGYCQSTVVRDGETLSRIGKMAQLFEDYSPLQLYAAGRWADGGVGHTRGFSVTGRLQYKTSSGTWSDWQLSFDDASTGSLSEDNGAFVLSTPITLANEQVDPSNLSVGQTTVIGGVSYQVTANDRAALICALGELPRLPPLGQAFDLLELRSAEGQVLSLDYSQNPPAAFLGVAVELDALHLTGLKTQSSAEGKGRQFDCPHCGAPVAVALSSSKSVTCSSCNSLIDLSSGIGAELRHAEQDEPVRPLIALGSTALLQGSHWLVVGFQHRTGHAIGDDEYFGWSEYLLYNARKGFCFLVDSEDGWSLVRPTTGAPTVTSTRQVANYQGKRFERQIQYVAETVYVAGEFYWPVVRGQTSRNIDFVSGQSVLSLEQTERDLTWSIGSKMEAAVVAKAFGLEGKLDLFKRADVGPTSGGNQIGLVVFIIFVVIIVVIDILNQSSHCDPNVQDCRSNASGGGYRSSGGSYGGFSGGGGHK